MTGFYLQNDLLRYWGWFIRFKNMKDQLFRKNAVIQKKTRDEI